VLRRRRTHMLTEVIPRAEAGMEAFRMCGVVRRRQERASQSGERFAFVSLSDPSGEYEVLFPPEALRKCREVLEPGKAVSIKVRAKARDGEVRFFGDDAEPIEKAIENMVAGLRLHLSPSATEIEALRETAGAGRLAARRRGQPDRRPGRRPRDRDEAARPLHPRRRPARRPEDRARRGAAGRRLAALGGGREIEMKLPGR
jgi:DNA polymerase-3 subunit alpha